MNVIVAAVMAEPGATVLATLRVAPQPTETIAPASSTLIANVRIVFLLRSRNDEESMCGAELGLSGPRCLRAWTASPTSRWRLAAGYRSCCGGRPRAVRR